MSASDDRRLIPDDLDLLWVEYLKALGLTDPRPVVARLMGFDLFVAILICCYPVMGTLPRFWAGLFWLVGGAMFLFGFWSVRRGGLRPAGLTSWLTMRWISDQDAHYRRPDFGPDSVEVRRVILDWHLRRGAEQITAMVRLRELVGAVEGDLVELSESDRMVEGLALIENAAGEVRRVLLEYESCLDEVDGLDLAANPKELEGALIRRDQVFQRLTLAGRVLRRRLGS